MKLVGRVLDEILEKTMTDAPRRGRPKGSTDSYPRSRRRKLPPPEILDIILPAVMQLVESSELNGYHKGIGRPSKPAQEAVDRDIAAVLGEVRRLVNANFKLP
jgi:hypothetical protein